MISQEQKGDEAVLRLMMIILVVLFNCVDTTGLSGGQFLSYEVMKSLKEKGHFQPWNQKQAAFFFKNEM